MLKEKFKRLIFNLDLKNIEVDYNNIESFIKDVVENTSNEKCIIYTDINSTNNKIVEVHFEDCNFYEIDINKKDRIEDIIRKVYINLIEERFKDKQNPNLNGNNERYFRKYN